MASERQNEANRRNAQKSTGPRTEGGKTRSRMNAFRHGFASKVRRADIPDVIFREGDGTAGYKCVNPVDIARSEILSEIDDLLLQPPSEAIVKAVRRLGALERYAARNFSQIKSRMQKLE
jgi:hypothetical protein